MITKRYASRLRPWVICPQRGDHIYPTCPAARRSFGGMSVVDDPHSTLDPYGFGVCGWCLRLWERRGRPTSPFDPAEVAAS